MSLTYYAVTDDPNELAHFGIKGMKWGITRTDAQLGHPRHAGSRRSGRPRSAAYNKASSKLQRMMKSGIKKVEAKWKAYNSPEAKYERQTNRAIEKARKGKLKYGKLDDYQVRRIAERLDLERQARNLSSSETRFRTRLAKSIGEGVISGVGQGFGRKVSEAISRGSTLKTDRLRMEQQNRMNLEQEKRKREQEKRQEMKLERKYAKQEARNKVKSEYYEQAARNAKGIVSIAKEGGGKAVLREARQRIYMTDAGRAKKLNAWKSADEDYDRQKAYNKIYDTHKAKYLAEKEFKPAPEPKKEKKKEKKKDKGASLSQQPIINIYTNSRGHAAVSTRQSPRAWKDEERKRRMNNERNRSRRGAHH